MSETKRNKAIVRRYFETLNASALDRLGDVLAHDFGQHTDDDKSGGIGAVRSYLKSLRVSFPDCTWTIEQIIAEYDRVVVLSRVTGTHLHDFGEIRATRHRVDFKVWALNMRGGTYRAQGTEGITTPEGEPTLTRPPAGKNSVGVEGALDPA